jgi:hypothetical protein
MTAGDLAALRELLKPIDSARADADRRTYGPEQYAATNRRTVYVQRGLLAATGDELVNEIERRLA